MAHTPTRLARGCAALLSLALAACSSSPTEAFDAGQEPAAIASDALCARVDDEVSELFCGDDPAQITSLAELTQALRLDRTLFLAHSTALDGRLASPINPRAVFVRSEPLGDSYAAATFTRGAQRAELISRDRRSGRLNFYMLDFEQACSAEPAGCSFGDRFTPAIERGWRGLHLRDDEDLKNTPLDCRRCHGGAPQDGGKPSLLMREMDPPWTHWFSTSPSVLQQIFYDAKQLEPYAGEMLPPDSPSLLEGQIRGAENELDQPAQPLTFLSGIIAIETLQLQLDGEDRYPGAGGPGHAPSPTWQLLFNGYRQGISPAPPYYHEQITDPDKLRAASDAYRAFVDGTLAQDELPDISDVLPDDQHTLAKMGFAVEPDAPMDVLLVQACGQCHNAALDQTLSRARFDIDLSRVSLQTLQLASARLSLPPDHADAMPPPGSRAMTAEQRRALRDYLREVEPSEISPRRPMDAASSPYALAPSYDYAGHNASGSELIIGDVSGDGRPDLISSPWVFVQQSDGSFTAPSALPVAEPASMTLIDVNEDGLLDIVSAGTGDGVKAREELGLTVLLSEGELTFSEAMPSPGPTPLDVLRTSFSDVDDDGHLDLVTRVARASDGVVVYLGDGGGSFTVADLELAHPSDAYLGALTLGDVTGDDRADLIVLERGAPPSLSIHAHDGAAGFVAEGERHEIPGTFASSALYLSTGDGNDDGRNDIAISPGIRLMLQDENGSFGPAPLIESNDGPAKFFDLNADGLQDLVGLAQSQGAVCVLLQSTLGLSYAKSASYLLPGTPGSVLDTLEVGDLDGDECADVVVARRGSIDVMRGEGCDR